MAHALSLPPLDQIFQSCCLHLLPLPPHHPLTSQHTAAWLSLLSLPWTCCCPDRKPQEALVVLIFIDLYLSSAGHCLPSLHKFSHTQASASRCLLTDNPFISLISHWPILHTARFRNCLLNQTNNTKVRVTKLLKKMNGSFLWNSLATCIQSPNARVADGMPTEAGRGMQACEEGGVRRQLHRTKDDR